MTPTPEVLRQERLVRRVTWQRRVMRALNQTVSALLLALIAAFVIGQALLWWLQ